MFPLGYFDASYFTPSYYPKIGAPVLPWLPSDDPLPRRVAVLPMRSGDFFANPTEAFFLNDPFNLNPANIPSWLPDDRPIPKHLPVSQKAQDWCEISNLLPVIPAEVNAGELVEDWPGLPQRPRPQTIKAQDTAYSSLIITSPVFVDNPALLDTAPPLPQRVPRLARHRIETFADPTGGWFLPTPVPPDAFLSWSQESLFYRPVPTMPVRLRYADASLPVKAPDIDVAQYSLGQQPIQYPVPVNRLTARAETSEVLDWSYVAQAQGWDQPAGIPRVIPRWNLDPSPGVAPIFPPGDALTSVIGWLQEVTVMPRPVPKTNLGESVAFVNIPAGFDPQSIQAPLNEAPGFPYYPRPKVQTYADPDPSAWLWLPVQVDADTHPAAWAETPQKLPTRLPRGLPGETAFVLDVSQANTVLLPWTDPAVLPRPATVLFRSGAYDFPPWYESVTIIVGGPYYAIAKQLQTTFFAVAGQILTE
jgi:hypothetical protein